MSMVGCLRGGGRTRCDMTGVGDRCGVAAALQNHTTAWTKPPLSLSLGYFSLTRWSGRLGGKVARYGKQAPRLGSLFGRK